MAPRATLPSQPQIVQFHQAAKIDRAIRRLKRRIEDIEQLRSDGVTHRDASVRNVQDRIRDTIQEMFGTDS